MRKNRVKGIETTMRLRLRLWARPSVRVIASSLTLLPLAGSVIQAQRTDVPRLGVVAEWTLANGPYGARSAVSPDGLMVAHFGEEFPAVLYIKNLANGEDKRISVESNDHADWAVVGSLAFSPDGSRLIFEAGPARKFSNTIYSVKIDGSDMSVLASDEKLVPEPSDLSGRTLHDVGFANPSYSPDGRKIFVNMVESNGKRDEDGRIDDSEDICSSGLLNPETQSQKPRKLLTNVDCHSFLSWSSEGSSFFYSTSTEFRQFDPTRGLLTSMQLDRSSFRVLGRTRMGGGLFVRDWKSNAVRIVNLDGSRVSGALQEMANQVPLKDGDGRALRSIEQGGDHELLLTYEADFRATDIARQHTQLVRFK